MPIHVSGDFYDVAGFKAGKERLRPFQISEVGDVSGKDLLHMQCHFGIETLSWARRGARVVGLDFSLPAIVEARKLAAELALDAEFVHSDVYDAPHALDGRDFDVLYTGLGAIYWLPDIRRWARVVASLIRPGGFLYLSEVHPFSHVFGDEDLTVTFDYFHREEPYVWEESGTYADLEAQTVHNRHYDWNHTLGDVVSAVIEAGLILEFLHEYDYTLFSRWPFLQKSAFDTYRLPESMPSLPLMYSLRAHRAQRTLIL